MHVGRSGQERIGRIKWIEVVGTIALVVVGDDSTTSIDTVAMMMMLYVEMFVAVAFGLSVCWLHGIVR